MTGCGAALIGDNDGWQDIFLVNGRTLKERSLRPRETDCFETIGTEHFLT
jgi:hypothetical protein